MSDDKINVSVDGINMPYSAEAEQSVLGAILIDSDNIASVMDILPTSDYFYLATHREIYKAMIELFVTSQPVDIVTVLEKLKGRRDFTDGDTKTYLMQLAEFVPAFRRDVK